MNRYSHLLIKNHKFAALVPARDMAVRSHLARVAGVIQSHRWHHANSPATDQVLAGKRGGH